MENLNAFNFYQDRKVTSWERTHFSIKSETEKQAEEIIKSWKGEDLLLFEDDNQVMVTEAEILFETIEHLSPEDNAGKPTIEICNRTGKMIADNSPVCSDVKSFDGQIDSLRLEIITAIRHLLQEKNLCEIDIPETIYCIYVVTFDDNLDPYECVVKNVALGRSDLIITAIDKSSDVLFEIYGPTELAARNLECLNDIYQAIQDLLQCD